MSKKIVFIISETGEVSLEAQGFKGRECLKASEPFRKALGIPDEAVEPTRDMYKAQETTREQVTLKNGS